MLSNEILPIFAALIVCCVLLAPLIALGWGVYRSNYTIAQYLFYLFGRLMTRLLWRARVTRRLPISDDRGAVIVCNHRGPFDPAFIQLGTDRIVRWMVAREYCVSPWTGWFFRIPGCIPTARSGIDTAATKTAIRYARSGELVGMLPEGRINHTSELLLPGRPGAALVALKARVPIIPCYIENSPYGTTVYSTLWTPGKATLVIGEPLDISEYYGREREEGVLPQVTLRILKAIALLAGNEEFQPRLAGRRWKTGEADEQSAALTASAEDTR